MKKKYLYPQINISCSNLQEVILASGMVDDDFNDGYNVVNVN